MDLKKIFDLISLFSPFLLVSFITILSIYNQDLKAIVLIFGLLILTIIFRTIGLEIDDNNDEYIDFCTMFNVIEPPGLSTAIISFIFISFLLPMFFNKSINPFMITTLCLLYISDVYFRSIRYKCFSKLTAILSTLIGLSIGSLYFFMIYFMGEEYYNLLYFNISRHNRVQCQMQTEQEFTCTELPED